MTQTTDAALVEQTRLLHMGPNADGSWGMELEGGPIPAIAEYLANMLGMRTDTPSNYVQMEVNRADLGAMVLTLQRSTGKTPHQLRVEAENKAAAAADTIEAQARRIEALEAIATGRWSSDARGYDLACEAIAEIKRIRAFALAALAPTKGPTP